MTFVIPRVSLLFASLLLCLPLTATAEVDPQPIGMRQICGDRAILDAPAGRVIAQAKEGAVVTVRDFGLGADGRGYYRIDLHDGYVATEDAPHFCIRPNEGAYRAPPNTCHLIIASRRSLHEVNEVADQYPAYQPTMAVYRASNGWYAVSLGLVTRAAMGPILAQARDLPSDSYCSDGAGYIAAMHQEGGRFVAPEGTVLERCLTGDPVACTARADQIKAQADPSKSDSFEAFRLWLLACMAGDFQICSKPSHLSRSYYDHPLLTALPDANARLGVMRDLSRLSCDAGAVDGCNALAGRELQLHSDTPPEYLTALQALTAACRKADIYACRDMFRLMERRQKVMATPVTTESWYQAAQLRAATCRHDPEAGDEFSCAPVYRAYTAFTQMAEAADPRVAQARDYLKTACEGGNTKACPLKTADDEFTRIAMVCQTLAMPEGAKACDEALSYYARNISATQTDALESVLQKACTSIHTAGCETLAFYYGPHGLSGEGLMFTGIDQPEKRLQALQNGCGPELWALPNCSALADTYASRGDHDRAAKTYGMACATIRENGEAALYVRGHDACFKAGLHALRSLKDGGRAQSYFDPVCNDPNSSDAPYACKHLGLLAGQSDAAFGYFQRACYPTSASRGDGEGCLLYGEALRDNRDRVLVEDESPPTLARATGGSGAKVDALINHAFATGCTNRWGAACAANLAVIRAKMAGAKSAPAVPCALRSPEGRVLSDKQCTHIRFLEAAENTEGEGELVISDLYTWPDGDRTLVQKQRGRWRVNGAGAEPVSEGDDTQCLIRHDTGTTLCVPRLGI